MLSRAATQWQQAWMAWGQLPGVCMCRTLLCLAWGMQPLWAGPCRLRTKLFVLPCACSCQAARGCQQQQLRMLFQLPWLHDPCVCSVDPEASTRPGASFQAGWRGLMPQLWGAGAAGRFAGVHAASCAWSQWRTLLQHAVTYTPRHWIAACAEHD